MVGAADGCAEDSGALAGRPKPRGEVDAAGKGVVSRCVVGGASVVAMGTVRCISAIGLWAALILAPGDGLQLLGAKGEMEGAGGGAA